MRSDIHRSEHSYKKEYWYNELNSLGIRPNRPIELNDIDELSNLTDNIKQTMYQDYKRAYSQTVAKNSYFEYIRQSFDYIR